MVPECHPSICKMLRLLALFFSSIALTSLVVASSTEESRICFTQLSSDNAENDSGCVQTDLPGDQDSESEGLSLVQKAARRLQNAAAKSALEMEVQNGNRTLDEKRSLMQSSSSTLTSISDGAKEVLSTLARQGQALGQRIASSQLVRSTTRSSATLAILIVAVVGLVALALLVIALQPGHSTREGLGHGQGSISQNFPRATHSAVLGRQGGPGYYPAPDSYKVPAYSSYSGGAPDARPTYRDSFMPASAREGRANSPPDSLQGSMMNVPDPGQRSLPRVSTPTNSGYGGVAPQSLPRVQGPSGWPSSSSRPSTSLNLAPAQTAEPIKQEMMPDLMMTVSHDLPPAPDVHHAPVVTGGFAAACPRRPPALCPMLVLPHCESFFAVPIDELVAGAETVEILGLSGNALLRSTVKDTEEGRVIEVSMSPPRSPPLASIAAPAPSGPREGLRELKGSRGKHYGWLRPTANGYILRCGDSDVMTVITNAGSGLLQLYAGSSGDMLAQAARSSEGENIFAAEDLEVRVTPGMDAVLALLCVVSSVLFCDSPTPFSAPFLR